MKKFMTVALATAMTAALACTAFADGKPEEHEFSASYNDVGETDASIVYLDVTDCASVSITFDFTDTYGGGGIGWNSAAAAGEWAYTNYSNDDAEHTVKVDCSDIVADEDGNKKIQVVCWWVGEPYYADFEYEVAASSGDAAPIIYLAAIVGIAGIAMVASKKRA